MFREGEIREKIRKLPLADPLVSTGVGECWSEAGIMRDMSGIRYAPCSTVDIPGSASRRADWGSCCNLDRPPTIFLNYAGVLSSFQNSPESGSQRLLIDPLYPHPPEWRVLCSITLRHSTESHLSVTVASYVKCIITDS